MGRWYVGEPPKDGLYYLGAYFDTYGDTFVTPIYWDGTMWRDDRASIDAPDAWDFNV